MAPQELWAGYQLWSIDALGPVVDAWVSAMGQIGDALSTSISVLHTPPGAPTFPPALQGVPIVHLAFASPQGPDAASPLLRALRVAPAPVVDSSWAPADAARRAEVLLDPPNPIPALGIGRWLGPGAPAVAAGVLDTAAAVDSPVAMVELRNLGNDGHTRDGAMTAVPGPFLLHAVGLATDVAPLVDDSEAIAFIVQNDLVDCVGGIRADLAVPDGRYTTSEPIRPPRSTDVRKLLADNRLVTLTGAGGAGKTRLAVEIAARIAAEFRDGVWYVEVWPRSRIPTWCRSRWRARWACPINPAAPLWTW